MRRVISTKEKCPFWVWIAQWPACKKNGYNLEKLFIPRNFGAVSSSRQEAAYSPFTARNRGIPPPRLEKAAPTSNWNSEESTSFSVRMKAGLCAGAASHWLSHPIWSAAFQRERARWPVPSQGREGLISSLVVTGWVFTHLRCCKKTPLVAGKDTRNHPPAQRPLQGHDWKDKH